MAFVINAWHIIHAFPIVTYSDGEKVAHVRYGGRDATLSAQFQREQDLRYNGNSPHIIDRGKSRVSIDGFAARFPKGRRIWNARLAFVRDDGEVDWSFEEAFLYNGPESRWAPEIIGFLQDYPARDRGLGGPGKKAGLRHRSRAGLPEGPKTADEFQDDKVWGFAESLWADETRDPFDTAKIVGASIWTLWRRFGAPAKFARLYEDARADA